MSYGTSVALQKAVYEHLLADADVVAQLGSAIYDAAPAGTQPSLFATIGSEDVQIRGDGSGSVARYRLTISVVSDAAGFAAAKAAAGAVSDALHGAKPSLDHGTLISMRQERVQASRVSRNKQRRIDLRFEALVDDVSS